MIPSYDNALLRLLRSLSQHKVECVICGGVAAVLHGVERMTVDIDISLKLSPENLALFLQVMQKESMIPRAPVPPEAILDIELLKRFFTEKHALVFTFIDPNNPYKQIDFFLGDDKRYEILTEGSETLDIGKNEFIRVVSIKTLIQMKEAVDPPRDKDLSDLKILRSILKLKNLP
jgi:hypothetical protein